MIRNWKAFLESFETTDKDYMPLSGTWNTNLYPIDNTIIEDAFVSLEDYKMTITYADGFINENNEFYPGINSYESTPCISLEIWAKNVKTDCTKEFKSFINRISRIKIQNGKLFEHPTIKIFESGISNPAPISIDEIELVREGFHIKDDQSYYEIQVCICLSPVVFTQRQIAVFFRWHTEPNVFLINNKLYLEMDKATLSKFIILYDNEYYNFYIDEPEFEYVSDYLGDNDDYIKYYLNKDNISSLLNKIGMDEVRKEFADFNSDLNDQEFISLICTKEPQRVADYIDNNNHDFTNIKIIYSDYYNDALRDTHYKEIAKEFDKVLNKLLPGTVTKEDTGIGPASIYQIPFNIEWIAESANDINKSLETVFIEYFDALCDSTDYSFNPRLSDYPDVDLKEFNKECKLIINNSKN